VTIPAIGDGIVYEALKDGIKEALCDADVSKAIRHGISEAAVDEEVVYNAIKRAIEEANPYQAISSGIEDAIKDAFSEVYNAVEFGVANSMPAVHVIMNSIADGVEAAMWTPLPPGSHLILCNEDETWERGVDVVALREHDRVGQVMTERGGVLDLNKNRCLKVGGDTSKGRQRR
jgi:hypothetical protein